MEKEEKVLHGGAELPCSPWKISARAEKNCGKEGVAEKNCYVLVVTPNPKCPCTAWDGGEEPGLKE